MDFHQLTQLEHDWIVALRDFQTHIAGHLQILMESQARDSTATTFKIAATDSKVVRFEFMGMDVTVRIEPKNVIGLDLTPVIRSRVFDYQSQKETVLREWPVNTLRKLFIPGTHYGSGYLNLVHWLCGLTELQLDTNMR